MVQFEALDAVNVVILAPAVGGAIRAAAEQAVQHRQERRPLQREVVLAPARQALDHAPAARLVLHPLEGKRRTEAPGRDRRRLAAIERIEHERLVGEARPERSKRSNCPLCCRSSIRPSVAITCWRTAAPLPALDDLQIGAASGSLLAELHGGEPGAESNLVRAVSACNPQIDAYLPRARHYNIAPAPRPKSYQWLTPHAHGQLSKITQGCVNGVPAS